MFYGPYNHVWAVAGGKSLEAIRTLWSAKEPLKGAAIHENLSVLGMAGPGGIQIMQTESGEPVAMMISNEVFPDPVDKNIFYIKIPVDYKGNIRIPEGAALIADSIPRGRLLEGGWGDIMPLQGIFEVMRQVDIPQDYVRLSLPPAPPGP